MKFDDAIKRLSQNIDKNGGQEKYQKEVIATLKSLNKEYAPTVEMTQAEFDEFRDLFSSGISTPCEAFDLIVSDRGETDEFEHLYNRLFTQHDAVTQSENQVEFSELWVSLSANKLKELVEIVPNMKWFLRSKKSDVNGYGWLSIIDKYPTPIYQYSHDKPLSMFVRFDTKEEAEEWKNQLTEAVQLPVEGE